MEGISCGRVARINSDGSLDSSYQTFPGANLYTFAADIQPDGKFVIGGDFSEYNNGSAADVARINADGSLDTSFNTGTGSNNDVNSLAIEPDGKVLVGGYFTTFDGIYRERVARLNADGSLDTGFAASADNLISKYAFQADNKILICGSFASINGVARNGIARLNTDGSLDTTFDPGSGANKNVSAVAVQSNGKVVIGGNFTSINGASLNGIARLNADGSVDTSFNPGSGADTGVAVLALQSDGKIVIGGNFNTINGIARHFVARLNGDPVQAPGAPVVTSATASAQAGSPFSFQIVATNSPASFGATGLPAGLSVDPVAGLISGVPTQSGSFSVGLSATNPNGTGTGTLTINIIAPPAPVITSGPLPNGQVGVGYFFQVAATNGPTSFSPAGLPPGLTLDTPTGMITGTPTQAGTFNATITATNSGGSGAAMYSVTILPAVPVITSAASASGQEGQAFTYQIAASNSPMSFNATGLPGGLNVDTTSGLISGTPTTTGSFTVTLSATNAGGTGSAMLTLDLSRRPSQTPTITSSAAASATVGVPFSFAVTASNSPSSFGAVGLPPGLNIDASSGLISGTPTQAGAYTVGITAANASGTGTGSFAVTVTVPTADVTALHIISPPSNIGILQGETISVNATVDALPGALAAVDYDVYDATDTNLVTPLSADTAAGNEFNWIPTALGDFTLRVTAIDTAGNPFTDSIPIHVVTSPNAAPISTLLSGLDGRTFAAGSTLPLLGLATDASGAALSNAAFYVNGVPVPAGASPASAGESGQLQPKDAPASQFKQASYQVNALEDALLTLAGTDSNGVTSISVAATLHFTAAASGAVPTCAITSPATAVRVVPGGPGVSVTATATEGSGAIKRVEFFVNNTNVGTASSAPYTLNIPTPAEGQFALTAIATDSQGLSQASAPVIVTVAKQEVTIAAAGDGQAVVGGKKGKATVTRTGDTSVPLTVRFKINGAVQAGVDYEALSKLKVTIPAGKAQATIKLTALGNPAAGGNRVAKIRLLPSTDGAYSLGTEVKAKIKLVEK